MQHRGISLVVFFLVLLPTMAFGQMAAGGYTRLTWPNVSATGETVPDQVQIFPVEETLLVSADDQTSGQTTTGAPKKTTNEPDWEWATGVSVGIAYSYTTGSPGMGAFNVGAGYRFKSQIEAVTDMDFGTSTVVLGGVTSKTKRQNYLFGGRYYINKALSSHEKFEPFGHLMYGVSHESTKATQGIPVVQTIEASQTSWAWDFGGGVDYMLSKHWALRGRADWLKTHFNSQGQSHFKWVVGFWYSFSARTAPKSK